MKQFGFDLTLEPDKISGQVCGALSPAFNAKPVTLELIKTQLMQAGFGKYYLFEANLGELIETDTTLREKGEKVYQELIKRIKDEVTKRPSKTEQNEEDHQGDEHKQEDEPPSELQQIEAITAEFIFTLLKAPPPETIVAERRDAVITVTTSEDELTVFLDIAAPHGGTEADEPAITKALQARGIKATLNNEAIAEAIEKGVCESLVIANGIAPKKGKDSIFTTLVQDQISSGPSVDSTGKTNYHDINQFVVIEPGTLLMRRGAPAPGKSGTDVFGKVIPAETGDVLPFFGGIEGAKVADDDHNLLVATQKGHPIIHDRGVSIDPVLQLTNVSLATGNVNYDGSVLVKQDVADGLKVEVTGDLIVEGVVGKATIIAGNNVIIKQGLIGGTPSEEQISDQNFGASVSAEGVVSARFATMAKIRAKKKISLDEYALHCDLYAEEQIVLGETSGKGNLIGGKAQAFNLVSAKSLGSTGSTVTTIRVGAPPNTLERYRRVTQATRQKQQVITDINENLHKFSLRSRQSDPPPQMLEMIAKLNTQSAAINAELADLQVQENELKTLLMRSKKSKVISKGKVHQNVIVHILGSSLRIKEDSSSGTFKFDMRQVMFIR